MLFLYYCNVQVANGWVVVASCAFRGEVGASARMFAQSYKKNLTFARGKGKNV